MTGHKVEKPVEVVDAELVDGLCRKYSCPPSAILRLPYGALSWLIQYPVSTRTGWERLRFLRRLKRLLCFLNIHQDVQVQRTGWYVCEQCLRDIPPRFDITGARRDPDRMPSLKSFKLTLERARKDRDGG